MVAGKRLAEILLPGPANRGDKLRIALGVAIVCVAQSGIAECSGDNGFIGGEVGVADAQVNNILVLGQGLGIKGSARAAQLKTPGNVVTLHWQMPP